MAMPTSRHRIWLIAALGVFLGATNTQAGTTVIGFYGWGDNFFGTSSGVDEIAAQARRIPGVTSVTVLNYWETQRAANIMMEAHGKIALYGYSCGANTLTLFYNVPRKINIAGIQPSLWCGGYQIASNVRYAQASYGNCLVTLGLGCMRYQRAAGSTAIVRNVYQGERHGHADNDPDYQRDVLRVIAATAGAGRPPQCPPGHHC